MIKRIIWNVAKKMSKTVTDLSPNNIILVSCRRGRVVYSGIKKTIINFVYLIEYRENHREIKVKFYGNMIKL